MNDSIEIVAIGDCSFNGHYQKTLRKKGSTYPFHQVTRFWADADLRIANLESPITTAKKFSPTKCELRGAQQTAETLASAKIDYVSLANNHAMDFGWCGIEDTMRELRKSAIAFSGVGTNASDAGRPYIFNCKQQKIALLSFCSVQQSSPLYATSESPGVSRLDEDSFELVSRLRRSVDWLIVCLHWGDEMCTLPSSVQRRTAERFVEIGVDAIVGHHPHVLQPIEVIKGVPVAYSLGNFLFASQYWKGVKSDGERFCSKLRIHPLSLNTGWLRLRLNRTEPATVEFWPAKLSHSGEVIPDFRRGQDIVDVTLRPSPLDRCYEEVYQQELEKSRSRLFETANEKNIFRRIELIGYRLGVLG